jgi:predicted dehydrogenase
VAAADPVESSLEWAGHVAEGRELHTFVDYKELLAADLCDVYVISSPNFTHREVLDDVLATGTPRLGRKAPVHRRGRRRPHSRRRRH